MELLFPWLYICLTEYKNSAETFYVDIDYNYSPTVYPLMAYLAYADKHYIENPGSNAIRVNLYEIEIRQLKNDGYILEAQLLHLTMFVFSLLTANEKGILSHLKNAAEIAYKHNFILPFADAYPYYKDTFNEVLTSYPPEFADKVRQCGLKIDRSFSVFSKKNPVSDIFYLLPNRDIRFVLHAVQGYSCRQVAEMAHASGRTVANRYAEIYDKSGAVGKRFGEIYALLGVERKTAPVELYSLAGKVPFNDRIIVIFHRNDYNVYAFAQGFSTGVEIPCHSDCRPLRVRGRAGIRWDNRGYRGRRIPTLMK